MSDVAEAAQVGRNRPGNPRRLASGSDAATSARRVREAVEQQHGGTLALVDHRELDAVTVDPPHDRAGYGVWILLNGQPLQPSGAQVKPQCEGHARRASGSSCASRATPATACSSPGSRFTDATAVFGNDLATLPDFPAEIRAPAGTVGGVSAFQIHFASRDILTPGDTPNVLVAMNPAALKANLGADAARRDDHRQRGRVHRARAAEGRLRRSTRSRTARSRRSRSSAIPMSSLTSARSRASRASPRRDAQKAKNLFALGLLSWLYDRPTEVTEQLDPRQVRRARVMEANLAAFRAGWSFGETSELIDVQVTVAPQRRRRARHLPQRQRHARRPRWAWSPRRSRAGCRWCFGAYPITPASELLHALSRRQDLGVRTIQAEDEIAAASIALGAAFGGALGVTRDVRPGPRPQDGDDRPGGDARAADGRSSTSSAPARRPACRPRPSSPTCCRRSTAATASRRCR